MSAVIQRTKHLYKQVMIVELSVWVSLSLLMCFILSVKSGISFGLGGFASFLPQCLFIFWVFFRKKSQHRGKNKIGDFYRGEGLKWLATMVLIVALLKSVSILEIAPFFAGYFLFLLCNSLLPLCLGFRQR